jgi:cytochrome b subunit of formate dehydrogenase
MQPARTRHSVALHLLVILGVTGLILLVPLVAMQFTSEVIWTGFDFAVAAALLTGTGLLFELALRKLHTKPARIKAGALLGVALLLVWAELAVGIVGA